MKLVNTLLLLFTCTIIFSQTRWEAYTFAAPINLSIEGNRIKNEGANIGELTTFYENTHEFGIGIRLYHKKNFGYELGSSLKNYKFNHSFEIPSTGLINRLTYSSRLGIDVAAYGIRTGVFYKYRKLTGKLLIEFNQPYRITGKVPRNIDYDIENNSVTVTTINHLIDNDGMQVLNGEFDVVGSILTVERFSMADDAVFYTMPELVLEYKINNNFDIYTGFKSRWYSKSKFHKIETVLTNYIDGTEQTQLIEMHHNFFFFSIGLRGNIQFGKKI